MTDEHIIKGENLSKSYGDLEVLSDLSFTVKKGEIYGLIGPNGAGKTTLINLLTGQDTPTTGHVTVDGLTVEENPISVKEQIGILPEKQSPFSFLTPRENFHFAGKIRGLDPDDVDSQIDYLAEQLQFTEHLDTLSTNLSRGNQQKVMVTQALLHNPDVLFIDEPVANLDPFIQEQLKQLLREFNEQGKTIVLSTHHLEFAQDLCSEALFVSSAGVESVSFTDTTKEELIERFTQNVGDTDEL